MRADDGCLVLCGSLNGTRILLVSDLSREGQAALLNRKPDLRADVLVTGLPTDGEAVGDAFLGAVRPQLIIVGDSDLPATERASAGLRERLARTGIPVIYTRDTGAATLVLGVARWELRTMNGTRSLGRQGSSTMTGARSAPDLED